MNLRQPPTLKAKALALLAQREHSRQELHQKLERWLQARAQVSRWVSRADDDFPLNTANEPAGTPGEASDFDRIPEVLDELESAGWLSQTRYVDSHIQAKSSRWGLRRLEQSLSVKGAALAPEQREQLRSTEHERARHIWAKRFGSAPVDPAEQGRQMRFLMGRGFSAALALQVIKQGGAPEDGADQG